MLTIEFDSLSVLLSLSLEITIAFLSLELFLIFFRQYSKKKDKYLRLILNNTYPSNPKEKSDKKNKRNKKIGKDFQKILKILQIRELSWGLMFFLIGNMMILQIIGDFYTKNENIRIIFVYARNLELILAMTLFVFSLESGELKSNRYIFSYIFIFLSGVLLVVTLIFARLTLIILYLGIPLIFLILFQFGLITYYHTRKFKIFRLPFFGLFIGFFLFIAGFILSQVLFSATDIPGIDLSGRMVGDFIQLTGILLLAVAFFFLPSLKEFTWYENLKKLLVIHQTGLCLFGYNFQTKEKLNNSTTDEDLTTSLLLSINMITQEITTSSESQTDVVHTDETVIIFEFGKFCTIALFVWEDSITVRRKVKEFCKKFEESYSVYLKNWSGNTTPFQNAEKLIHEIFSPVKLEV